MIKKKFLKFITVVLIALGGCTVASNIKEEKVSKKTKLLDVRKDIKLPEYYNVKSKNMYENITIIYPASERSGLIVAKAIASDILKNKNSTANILEDKNVKKSDLNNGNVIVIGNTANSVILNEMQKYLPVYADGEKIIAGDKVYSGKEYGVTYFYPNLYNFNYTMIFIMGNSEKSLKMYDFSKEDIVVYKGTKEISPVNYIEVAFGKFDKNWKIERLSDVDPKLLDTGENDKLEVGEIKKYDFPEWARGKVIYEIFPRSFYDSNNDGRGDLKGIVAKLDYLKELGVDIIWLTPFFDSPSYHGYDVRDYFSVGKDYGTNEDFRLLAQEIHKRGMKIIIDMPFNHVSKQSAYFRDAYNNPESKYDRWFYFSNLQNTIYHDWYFRENPERRDTIDSGLPAWNTNNIEVVNFHAQIAEFWMDPNKDGDTSDGADGFRLDYAKGPSHEYWKLLRQKIKSFKHDAFLLAELWIPKDEIFAYFDNQFDAAFDFDFQGAATTGVMKDIDDTLMKEDKFLTKDATFARFLSNHDLDRFPSYKKPFELKLYSTMIYTLPGMPTLYYGDEIGMKGDKGEYNGDEGRRRPMEWYKDNKGPGMARWIDVYDKKADGISVEEQEGVEGSLLEHYKKLSKIRKENLDTINNGKRIDIKVYEEKEGKEVQNKKIKVYFMVKDNKKLFVILNFSKEGEYLFDLSNIDFDNIKFEDILNNDKKTITVKKEKMKININGTAAYILKSK